MSVDAIVTRLSKEVLRLAPMSIPFSDYDIREKLAEKDLHEYKQYIWEIYEHLRNQGYAKYAYSTQQEHILTNEGVRNKYGGVSVTDFMIDRLITTIFSEGNSVLYPDLYDENNQRFNKANGEQWGRTLESLGLIFITNERWTLTPLAIDICEGHGWFEYKRAKAEKENAKSGSTINLHGPNYGQVAHNMNFENSTVTNNASAPSEKKDKTSKFMKVVEWVTNNKLLSTLIAAAILYFIKVYFKIEL